MRCGAAKFAKPASDRTPSFEREAATSVAAFRFGGPVTNVAEPAISSACAWTSEPTAIVVAPHPARRVQSPRGGSRLVLAMKITSAEFAISAPDLRSAPSWARPEFALIGRSNVGKSSLINLLAGRRDLARVSDTPGKTQLINFFVMNRAWALVDLPGYGYSDVGKQRRYDFNVAVADFLAGREQLRGILVLIDSRLPPKAIDLEFLRWLDDSAAVPAALVFTKLDKQSASKGRVNIDAFLAASAAGRRTPPVVLGSSAKTGDGRSEILAYLAARLGPPDARKV
jgi:GTP-binding protein